jgi:hypothetical protein
MLWVNKDINAEQILTNSLDMMAAIVYLPERLILVVLTYVLGGDT